MTRTLRHLGVCPRRPWRVPLLNRGHRAKRREFAATHQQWGPSEWARVCFSDEKLFKTRQSGGRLRVWADVGVPDYLRPVEYTVQSPQRVMVWAMASSCGLVSIKLLDGTINGLRYKRDILQSEVVPKLREWRRQHGGSPLVYMDDNAPIHRARVCRDFLRTKRVPRLPWPAMSPDLNPIENLWAQLSARVRRRQPQSKADLEAAITEEWAQVATPAKVAAVIDSMPRRVATLRQLRGGATGY